MSIQDQLDNRMLGDMLSYLLETHSLTISELARMIDRPASTISSVVNGRSRNPSIYLVSDIIRVFGVPLDYLLYGIRE